MNREIVIGTRGSTLALAQTRLVERALAEQWPEHTFRIQIIRTEGDMRSLRNIPEEKALTKGMFTHAFDQALREETIDFAVHSLKDLPVEEAEGTTLAAIPVRADARDRLIVRGPVASNASPLDLLPPGAIVATGSRRRSTQMLRERLDLHFVEVRGNIDTRLRKLRENPTWSAILLAAAGLDRIDLNPNDLGGGLVSLPLPYELMLPAPGQGAIAIQARRDDDRLFQIAVPLDHAPTRAAVTAERAFLAALGGGCKAPVGAYGQVEKDALTLRGIVWQNEEAGPRFGTVQGKPDDALDLGRRLAAQVLSAP